MKHLSAYLLSAIMLTSLPTYTESNFWKTVKKDMSNGELFLKNIQGALFDQLPNSAKKAGKTITVTMPDCQSDTLVNLMFPGVQGIGQQMITKVATLTSTKNSQTIIFPTPFNQQDDTILVRIFPKTTAYTNYFDFINNHNMNKLTAQQRQHFEIISNKFYQESKPENVIKLRYKDLKNHQTVSLPYPTANKPTKNYLNDHIIANMDGAVFNALPDSIKNSGKRIRLTLPDCGKDICVTIRQSIKQRPDLGLVAQVVTFSKKTQEITIHLPEIELGKDKSQEIMIETAPNKDVKRFNKNFKKYHNRLHTLTSEKRKKLFKEFPKHFSNYDYLKLKDGQTLTLTCPTKTWLQQL